MKSSFLIQALRRRLPLLISAQAAALALLINPVKADQNWDGDNAAGNFSFGNNWFGDTVGGLSGFGFANGSLNFSFRNNGAQTSLFYDFGSWAQTNDIRWASTFGAGLTLNGNGQGLDFNQRLENNSSFTQTIGASMNLSGAKNGATQIELNPVNGGLTIDGTIFNDNSRPYQVYGNNGHTLTVNSGLGVGGTPASVGFTINQNSNVVFTANQTYGGTTTISAGSLTIGNGGATGSLGTGSVTNNSSLVYNRSGNLVLSNAISGSGSLTQNGPNIITISSANTYTGATIINSGTMRVTANDALGTGAAGTTVNAGGQLRLVGANYTTAEALSINGNGSGTGALYNFAGSSTYAGQVTAATNATIGSTGGSLTLTGGVVKNGTVLTINGNGSVIVNTTGISGASIGSDLVVDTVTLVVNAASNYNGPTTVQNGGKFVANAQIDTTTATIDAGSTLSGTSKVVAASGGSLFLNGQFIVGNSTLGSPVVSQFEAATSGAGSTVVGATGVLNFDLFSGAGLGNNTGNAAAADLFKITGALSLVAGSTLEIANPNSLTGWLWGDQWKIWDTTSMGTLTGVITTINAPTLGGGLVWDLDETTGVLSIVPEPSKALFSLLGLFGLLMRRRRA